MDFRNLFVVSIGEGISWFYPKNGSNVGPTRHVATVVNDNIVFISCNDVPGLVVN